ncbi:MAG TPA: hypothetical protein VMY77_14480 [Chitinophagaceae bacterium]|nr:hypothetical protein [Chitinophagaceae bacterium]
MKLQLKNDQYRDIGHMLYSISPDMAIKLLDHVEGSPPELRDLSMIPKLFKEYCTFKNIKETDFAVRSFITSRKRHGCVVREKNTPRNIMRLKQVFIAVIINLYNPELLSTYYIKRNKRNRRNRHLAAALNCKPCWISQVIPTIITMLKVYEDFKEEVELSVNHLKEFIKIK